MLRDTCGIQVPVNVNVISGVNKGNIVQIDHTNCVCKNKLIGRVIEESTSVINETVINNNKDNITNNNTYLILFIVFLIGFIAFLIGIIYYCRRSNFDRKKLKDFIYPKTLIY